MNKEKTLALIVHPSQSQGNKIATLMQDQYSTMLLSDLDEVYSLFKIIGYKTKIVLLHNKLPTSCEDVITALKKLNNSPEFLVISDHDNLTEAVDVMKAGAFDYIIGPLKKISFLQKLQVAIDNIDYTQKLKDLTERIVIEQASQELRWQKTNPGSNPLETLKSKLKQSFSESKSSEKPHILIVEDDESIISALEMLLKKEFKVFTAQDGKACQTCLKTEQIDLVLLDIYLPDTTGIALLSDIQGTQDNCAVIIMTAYKEIDIAIKALQQGAHDYLNKPFLELTLLSMIHKHLKLQSLKKILPKLQNWVTENIIPKNEKISMLNECNKSKENSQTPLKMSDFYAFFPELRHKELNDSSTIPDHILEEGLMPFLDTLKNQ
eukprot:COSAG01_NODE_9_length_43729_cov_66.133463_11_plen_379_part_00